MNLYAHDLSLLDFNLNYSDPINGSFSRYGSSSSLNSTLTPQDDDGRRSSSTNQEVVAIRNRRPPKHRHDGMSPLPLGMDWSPPPRKWDGRDSVWPHDPHSGWSYCVTVPSWILIPKPRGSDSIVFYRVQAGIQSPEAVTTTRGILRRFSDFLKLYYELKDAFPRKKLPPAPPRKILRIKSRNLLEARRCSLEDWMQILLSDIDISRSFQVATFLELEATVRSSFNDESQQVSDADTFASGIVSSSLFKQNSDVSLLDGGSSFASDYGNDSCYDTSELGSPRHGDGIGIENLTSNQDFTDPIDTIVKYGMSKKNLLFEKLGRISRRNIHTGIESSVKAMDKVDKNSSEVTSLGGNGRELSFEQEKGKLDGHVRRLSTDSLGSDLSSIKGSEISNLGVANLFDEGSLDHPEDVEVPRAGDRVVSSGLQVPNEILVVLPSEDKHKLNRVLITVQQRLATARTDMEDLIARLNQELAVRLFLTTKVKDLEAELETTRQNCNENMQQAVLTERGRFTQMQWDMEELRRKCLELELKLISEQDEKVRAESEKISVIQENDMLLEELNLAREQLQNSQKQLEESEVKSKADLKLLVKEVKSLRSSQSELKQELSRLMKEKLELERVLQKEKARRDRANNANAKLLHECAILRNRLQECSVNFLSEEEDKLILDTSSPSDAIDLLTTSDNRIGLLLAEAQLLAQDIENTGEVVDETRKRTSDNEMRKMLTDVFVDNARLRMQVNSVIRCALNSSVASEKDDGEEEMPLRKTVLSKFLEK